jgi:hypothetical protein
LEWVAGSDCDGSANVSREIREALLATAAILRDGGPVRREELVRGAARALNLPEAFPSAGPIEVHPPAQPIIAELNELRQLACLNDGHFDKRGDRIVFLTSTGWRLADDVLNRKDVVDSGYRDRIGLLDAPFDPLPPEPREETAKLIESERISGPRRKYGLKPSKADTKTAEDLTREKQSRLCAISRPRALAGT